MATQEEQLNLVVNLQDNASAQMERFRTSSQRLQQDVQQSTGNTRRHFEQTGHGVRSLVDQLKSLQDQVGDGRKMNEFIGGWVRAGAVMDAFGSKMRLLGSITKGFSEGFTAEMKAAGVETATAARALAIFGGSIALGGTAVAAFATYVGIAAVKTAFLTDELHKAAQAARMVGADESSYRNIVRQFGRMGIDAGTAADAIAKLSKAQADLQRPDSPLRMRILGNTAPEDRETMNQYLDAINRGRNDIEKFNAIRLAGEEVYRNALESTGSKQYAAEQKRRFLAEFELNERMVLMKKLENMSEADRIREEEKIKQADKLSESWSRLKDGISELTDLLFAPLWMFKAMNAVVDALASGVENLVENLKYISDHGFGQWLKREFWDKSVEHMEQWGQQRKELLEKPPVVEPPNAVQQQQQNWKEERRRLIEQGPVTPQKMSYSPFGGPLGGTFDEKEATEDNTEAVRKNNELLELILYGGGEGGQGGYGGLLQRASLGGGAYGPGGAAAPGGGAPGGTTGLPGEIPRQPGQPGGGAGAEPPMGGGAAAGAGLAAARQAHAKELADPEVRKRLFAYAEAEVGGQGPEAKQAFLESVLNRASARGKTISETLSSSYFPKSTHDKAAKGISQEKMESYSDVFGNVMGGSNISGFATGNASGGVGFGGGPQTYSSPGANPERFGIEKQDQAWADRMKAGVGAGADAPGAGGDRGGVARTYQTRKGDPGEFNAAASGIWGRAGTNQTTIQLKNGKSVTVNAALADRYKGFLNELIDRGYKIDSVGGYNYRAKAGGGGLSMHAYGAAVDINPGRNPMRRGGTTDMPTDVEDMAWRHGLSWGGRFGDPMHFEGMSDAAWKRKQEILEARESLRKQNEAQKVEGSGKIKVDVNAPRGTKVDAEGDGLFRTVEINRQVQMDAAARGPSDSTFGAVA
jgi:hypothetical protein